ncbi:transcriptional regulator, LysR family [Marinomonas posidonica IVIA-Po-181]|uniref:Transcriptional regulator, LysR family n=1 Tax=Marinomonas posidonica (strain CECT 7376 / NCIMB 14433 / IVIA-Po-181) TaxID=491952 RepID=F6CW46_MARPP|nr:transcriptional regulator, LysR family [Marinomonas posidonica IVIA-Po-181]
MIIVSKIHRNKNLPPLNALAAFEAAAKHQSFTKAAEELHLTHGAISRAVAQVEERIGVDLFLRRHRRVYLTAAGQRLLKTTSQSLDALSRTVEEIHRHDLSSPFLVVSCEPSLAMRWLMPRLGEFKALCPDLHIDLRMAGGPIDLLAEGCDVAIRRMDFTVKSDYQVTRLCAEFAGPVCSHGYWTQLENQNLNNANWLHSRTRPQAWYDWLSTEKDQTMSPNTEQHFDHFFYALQAAQDHLGVVIGSVPLVSDDLQKQRLIAPLGLKPTGVDYALLTLDGVEQDPRIAQFSNWLLGVISDT